MEQTKRDDNIIVVNFLMTFTSDLPADSLRAVSSLIDLILVWTIDVFYFYFFRNHMLCWFIEDSKFNKGGVLLCSGKLKSRLRHGFCVYQYGIVGNQALIRLHHIISSLYDSSIWGIYFFNELIKISLRNIFRQLKQLQSIKTIFSELRFRFVT